MGTRAGAWPPANCGARGSPPLGKARSRDRVTELLIGELESELTLQRLNVQRLVMGRRLVVRLRTTSRHAGSVTEDGQAMPAIAPLKRQVRIARHAHPLERAPDRGTPGMSIGRGLRLAGCAIASRRAVLPPGHAD